MLFFSLLPNSDITNWTKYFDKIKCYSDRPYLVYFSLKPETHTYIFFFALFLMYDGMSWIITTSPCPTGRKRVENQPCSRLSKGLVHIRATTVSLHSQTFECKVRNWKTYNRQQWRLHQGLGINQILSSLSDSDGDSCHQSAKNFHVAFHFFSYIKYHISRQIHWDSLYEISVVAFWRYILTVVSVVPHFSLFHWLINKHPG